MADSPSPFLAFPSGDGSGDAPVAAPTAAPSAAAAPVAGGQISAHSAEDIAALQSSAIFESGKIPEMPPPKASCQAGWDQSWVSGRGYTFVKPT